MKQTAGRNIFQVARPIAGNRRELRKQTAKFVRRFAQRGAS